MPPSFDSRRRFGAAIGLLLLLILPGLPALPVRAPAGSTVAGTAGAAVHPPSVTPQVERRHPTPASWWPRLVGRTPGESAPSEVRGGSGAVVGGRWYNVTNGTRLAASVVASGPSPPAVTGAAIASDGGFGTPSLTVLFGGFMPDGSLSNLTWVYVSAPGAPRSWWNGTNASDAPPPLAYASMTFDPRIPAFVLFGGVLEDQTDSDETWFLNETNGRWTNYTANACAIYCPTQRSDAGLVFAGDAHDDQAVLFGGCSDWYLCYATTLNDTWVLDQYTLASAVYYAWIPGSSGTAPSPRFDFAMAFAGPRNLNGTVLFGGCNATTCGLDDTWLYANRTWTDLTARLAGAGPPPPGRTQASLAFDGAQDSLVLMGGFNDTVSAFADSWWLACSPRCAWTNSTAASGDVPEYGGAMPANASADDPVLFGGFPSNQSAPSTSTWVYQPATGYERSIVPTSPEAGEPTNLSATGTGGSAPDSFFVRWTLTAPNQSTISYVGNLSERFGAAGSWTLALVVIDLNDVLFESETEILVRAPTLHQVGGDPAATDVGLPVEFNATLAGNATAPYNFTWQFPGGPSLYGANVSRSFPAPGRFNVTLSFRDAYSTTVTTVVEVVHPTPSANVSVGTPTPVALRPVNFSSTVTNGTPSYAYAWSFGDGETSQLADPSHTFARPGVYVVRLNVTDAVGEAALPVELRVVVATGMPLAATAQASETSAAVGGSVQFTALPTGGAPPYAYAWNFGDAGSGSGSPIAHAYDRSGRYVVTLWVNDSAGASVSTTVVVTVGPGAGSGSGGLPGWIWVAVAAVAIAAVAGTLVLLRRRS